MKHAISNPVISQQGFNLRSAIKASQPKMRVQNVQSLTAKLHLNPERSALLAHGRQGPCVHQRGRESRHDRVAVFFLDDVKRWIKMRLHFEERRYDMRLVDPTCPPAPDIKLLQGNNISARRRNHVGDAVRICLSISADAAVHIVGQNRNATRPHSAFHFFYGHAGGTGCTAVSFQNRGQLGQPDGGCMTARRILIKLIFLGTLILAGYLLTKVFHQYSMADIIASIGEIPAERLLKSGAFAAASYLCLTGFDWLGLRYAGKPLAYHRAAIASFTALSIGHSLGMAALSSGAVRYRFYRRWGLNSEEIAKVVLLCGVTVGLGLIALSAITLLANPVDAGKALGLDLKSTLLLGLGCAAVAIVYLILSATAKKPLTIWRWHFHMPGLSIAIAQMFLGTLNFVFVSACLHQLISAHTQVSLLSATTAFVLANIAVILTHVPGGLGILEATVSHILPGDASVGALVAFRAIYFLLPLVFGVIGLTVAELSLRRRPPSEDRGEGRSEARKHRAQTA